MRKANYFDATKRKIELNPQEYLPLELWRTPLGMGSL
jgi:hypothetical protein